MIRYPLFWNGILVHDFLPNWIIFFHFSSTLLSDLFVTKNWALSWSSENGNYIFQALNHVVHINLNPWVLIKSNYHVVKFSFPEKATKIWRKIPLVLTLLSKNSCFVKTGERFFQILWPSQNVLTLPDNKLSKQTQRGIIVYFWINFSFWSFQVFWAQMWGVWRKDSLPGLCSQSTW